MDENLAKNYYLREDIQKALLNFAKQREVGVMYDKYFGKRPDVIEYLSDVKNFVKKGVCSFHISEERWSNPLLLENKNLTEDEKNKIRTGWDLILDLDGVDFIYAKIAGKIIIEFLESLNIKNISLKFSGNKGFHIGIPFEAFSYNILGIGETKNLFPFVARKIASYLIYELKYKISKAILENDKNVENISKKYNIELKDLIIDDKDSNNLNYLKLIEIDTILIATRHLFRCPYSLHEKSNLVSIPVQTSKILEFDKKQAEPDVVNPKDYENFEFLKYNKEFGKDADILLIKAYEDDYLDMVLDNINVKKKDNSLIEITEDVFQKDFPECIKYVLENQFLDGKKRAIFLLLTFLYSINWKRKNIEDLIYNWNLKQEMPLKKNYINAQISWFDVKQKKISPPNFNNDNYYKSIGISKEIIDKDKKKLKNNNIKNPLHYIYIFLQNKKNKK